MTLKNQKPHFNVKFLKGYGCAINLKGNEVTLKNGLSPFSDSREVNLNADKKRLWLESLTGINHKMNRSLPLSLNYFTKDEI